MAGMLSCAFSYRSENPDVVQTRLSSKSVNVSVSMLNSVVLDKYFSMVWHEHYAYSIIGNQRVVCLEHTYCLLFIKRIERRRIGRF